MSSKSKVRQVATGLFGGPKAVRSKPRDLFTWPIITDEDRRAVLDVLNRGAMSQLGVTKAFEAEFAQWQGDPVRAGAQHRHRRARRRPCSAAGSAAATKSSARASPTGPRPCPCYNAGRDGGLRRDDPDTLCLAPNDIERRISQRTKAILVVHYLGYPADMDPIMKIARKHKLKVIEDVSHAQGGLYKGRKLGTIGDVAGDVADEREVLRRSAKAGSW